MCGLQKLNFVNVDEFPGETPDFSDILGGFAIRRCQGVCRPAGSAAVRIALCAEDVEEVEGDDGEFYDKAGYLVGICPRHAPLVVARAVEGRASC